MKNYYQILGLDRNATQEDIKKAYRLYATKFHPDKQDGDKFFEERFKEIKEAYDILSDEKKRRDYDAKFYGKRTTQNSTNVNVNTRKTQSPTTYKKAEKILFDNELILITDTYVFFKHKKIKINIRDLVIVKSVFYIGFVIVWLLMIFLVFVAISYPEILFEPLMLFITIFSVALFVVLFNKRNMLYVKDKNGRVVRHLFNPKDMKQIVEILKELTKL